MKKGVAILLLTFVVYLATADDDDGWTESEQVSKGGCQIGQVNAPINYENYTEQSSLLQIFAWMRAPCEGIVRSVTFVNHAAGVNKNFYFAIFEPIVLRPGSFRIVNYINVPVNSSVVGWQTVQLPPNGGWKPPLRVAKASVFGYFYDFWDSDDKETVIPYRTNYSASGSNFQTFVGFLSISDIRQIREFRSGIELNKQPLSRIPAMVAKVSPEIDTSLSCGDPPTAKNAYAVAGSATVMSKSLAGDFAVYQCNAGYTMLQNMFVICQPDAIWSHPPYCAPVYGYRSPAPVLPTLEILTHWARPRITTTTTTTPAAGIFCDDPPEIANAFIISTTNIDERPEVGDVTTYQCEANYTFADKNVTMLTCLENLQWSSARPKCVRIKCTSTLQISNADVSYQGDGSVVVNCYPGFIASTTDNVVHCDPFTMNWWPSVQCLRTCGAPPKIDNAEVIYQSFDGNNSIPGSVVRYVCQQNIANNPAWTPQENDVVCNEFGKWPSQLPFCVVTTPTTPRSSCGVVPNVDNAFVASRSFQIGSPARKGDTVRYQCVDGFTFASKSTAQIECMGNGWSAVLPRCVATCGQAPTFSNAQAVQINITGLNSLAGDFVQFACKTGYVLNGTNSVSYCQSSSAKWSPISQCLKSCGAPPRIPRGYLEFASFSGTNSLPGSKVRYNCSVGYELVKTGFGDVTCLANGQWTTYYLPECRLVTTTTTEDTTTQPPETTTTSKSCDRIPLISNGYIANVGDFYSKTRLSKLGVVVKYHCYYGSQFEDGSPTDIICRLDGWSQVPSCFVIANKLERLSPCGRLPSVDHAKPTLLISLLEVQYSCDSGYDVASDSSNLVLTCLSNNHWSSPYPECVPSVCGKAPDIANGRVSSTTYGSGFAKADDVTYYRCLKGYQMLDPTVTSATCLGNGTWAQLPQCVRVTKKTTTSTTTPAIMTTQNFNQQSSCGPAPVVQFGKIVRQSDSSDSSSSLDWIEYDCLDGYSLAGFNRVVCANSMWSDPPYCMIKGVPVCSSPPIIPHGYVLERRVGNSTSFHGNRVTYVCDFGFTISGNPEAICINEQWGLVPTCIHDETVQSCGNAPTVDNGIIVYKDFTEDASLMGNKVTYRCLDGFVLTNGSHDFVTCLRDGTWSSPAPRCLSLPTDGLYCGPKPNVDFAKVVFSNIAPNDVGNAPPGSLVIYECVEDYTEKLKSYDAQVKNWVQCALDGKWTEPLQCIPDQICQHLPTIENGRIVERTYNGIIASVGDKVWFSCLYGYELRNPGNTFTQCGPDGTWSSLPVCQAVAPHCNHLDNIPNSRIIYQNADSTCYVFSCEPGYSLVGSQTLTCGPTGVWSDSPPTCVQNFGKCSLIPTIVNGFVLSQSFASNGAPSPGDYLLYRCKTGFLMDRSNSQIVCLSNGQWSEPPKCISQATSCGPVPIVQNAQVTYTTVHGNASVEGDIAWYDCRSQFEPVGSTAIRCLSNNTWTVQPYCRLRNVDSCGNPPNIENGFIVGRFPSNTNPVGSQVTYACLSKFDLYGNKIVTCQAGGTWSHTPTCNPTTVVTCGAVPTIAFAKEVDRNFVEDRSVVGSFFSITCQPPYYIQGNNRAQCHDDGQWSELPQCVTRPTNAVSCGPVPQIDNADVIQSTLPDGVTTSISGDQIWYSCRSGSVLSGYPGVTCHDDGTWSDLPACSQSRTPSFSDRTTTLAPTNNSSRCPNGINLVFVSDLIATPTFKLDDAKNVALFLRNAIPVTQSVLGPRVTLGVGGVTLDDKTFNRAEHFFSGDLMSSKANELLLRWNTWVDANILPITGAVASDLPRLFATVRTQILQHMPNNNALRLVLLTSAQRTSASIGNAAGEIAALRSSPSMRAFVFGIGDGVSGSDVQTGLKQTVSSDSKFFHFIPSSQQLNDGHLLTDNTFIDFLCSTRYAPRPGSAASMS